MRETGTFFTFAKDFVELGGSQGKVRVYGKGCGTIRVDTRRKLVIIAVVGKIGNPLRTESASFVRGVAVGHGFTP
jgi:hypothetical protein